MKAFDQEHIAADIKRLGIGEGDKVLVRAALRAVGRVAPDPRRTVLDALVSAVGDEGAIIGLTFTKSRNLFRRDSDHPFTEAEAPITGAFAKQMLAYPGAFRSRHPTNSFVAIGAFREALERHDENADCFSPMTDLIDQNGKMLLIGCIDASPGFSTVHLAQHELGYSGRTMLSGVTGRYYRDPESSELKWFSKKDVPGCSMGFRKFYPAYESADVLRKGKIGNADCYMISAEKAFEIEREILARDANFALCEQDHCLSCRLLVTHKWPEPIRFLKGLQGQRRGNG